MSDEQVINPGSNAIQGDFDRIALVSQEGWDHNSHYHDLLLNQIPSLCGTTLDIGCGTGAFSRLLADRSERVVALDLSSQMVRIARERSGSYPNVDYQVIDVSAWEFPVDQLDCVATIATLHHLPMVETLTKMRDSLRVGGVLVVLDLYQEQGMIDALTSALAVPVDKALRLLKTGSLTISRQVCKAWAEHGEHDSYATLSQIRQVCATVLPGARVKRHLLWRYSVVWTKPAPTAQT